MRHRKKSGIRCLFILAVGVVTSSVHAADFSVYHMGNSLTGDLLSKFRLVATSHLNAQGYNYKWGAHFRAAHGIAFMYANSMDPSTGSIMATNVEYHWGTRDKGTFVPWTKALPENHWDAVTLQPWPDGSKPTLKTDTEAINAIIKMTRTRADNASTRFYIYAAWTDVKHNDFNSFRDAFLKSTANKPDQPTEKTRDYYRHLADSVRQTNPDVGMIPVGEVHLALDERMKAGKFEHFTSVQQLHRDVIHANQIGAYVAAWTAYAIIFRKSPVGLPVILNPGKEYPPFKEVLDVSPADLKLMQETVWEVVNSPELRSYTNLP